ncbi:MAG: di-heme oxidoredictase family protein, partial [Bacteroidota bacterium]
QGKRLFFETGCTACHTPSYQTQALPDFPEMADLNIRPFTDLLLHDMGPELADGRPDGQANGQEWRTPPLWGIGLVDTVNGHTRFLHDGRARNLEEAILWHGGEGTASREAFKQLSAEDRQALLTFLQSL